MAAPDTVTAPPNTNGIAPAAVNGNTPGHTTAESSPLPTTEDEAKFTQLLESLIYNGSEPLFHSKSKWTDVLALDQLKTDPRFTVFNTAKHSQMAHDHFEKFCWAINDQLIEPKKKLKTLLKQQNCAISPKDTVPKLMKLFDKNEAITESITRKQLQLLFAEMIAKQQYLSDKRANTLQTQTQTQTQVTTTVTTVPAITHTHTTTATPHTRTHFSPPKPKPRPRSRTRSRSRSPVRDVRRDRHIHKERRQKIKLSSFDERDAHRKRERPRRSRSRSRSKGRASAKEEKNKSYPTLPPPFPPPQAYLEMMHRHHENLKKHIEHDRFTGRRGRGNRGRGNRNYRMRDRRDRSPVRRYGRRRDTSAYYERRRRQRDRDLRDEYDRRDLRRRDLRVDRGRDRDRGDRYRSNGSAIRKDFEM